MNAKSNYFCLCTLVVWPKLHLKAHKCRLFTSNNVPTWFLRQVEGVSKTVNSHHQTLTTSFNLVKSTFFLAFCFESDFKNIWSTALVCWSLTSKPPTKCSPFTYVILKVAIFVSYIFCHTPPFSKKITPMFCVIHIVSYTFLQRFFLSYFMLVLKSLSKVATKLSLYYQGFSFQVM